MAKRKLTPAQAQIAKAEREALEAAFVTLFCQCAGMTRDAFDDHFWHGLGDRAEPASYRQVVNGRKWTWDFVASGNNPAGVVVVEINGGQGSGAASGHGSWAGLHRDAEKQNAAVRAGFVPFVFTTSMLDGRDPSEILELARFMRRRGDIADYAWMETRRRTA